MGWNQSHNEKGKIKNKTRLVQTGFKIAVRTGPGFMEYVMLLTN